MNIAVNPGGSWQEVAVFEMASEGADSALKAFMMRFESDIDHDRRCVIRNAAHCPNGYRWFEARIDFSIGEWRAVHLASALVTELSRASFGNYRLDRSRHAAERAHEGAALGRHPGGPSAGRMIPDAAVGRRLALLCPDPDSNRDDLAIEGF